MHHDENTQSTSNGLYWGAFLVFLAIALFFLWTEHRAHLLGVLPYAIFLLCPLLHLLMHRGHRHE